MEPVTLTAATIATLLFSEAIKEGGKSLGSAVSKVLGQLMAIVRQRFKAGGTEGLLARAEKQPTAANINLVQAELVAQMSEDEGFAAQLQDLLAQLEAAGAVRQVMASGIEVTGDFEAKEMRQMSYLTLFTLGTVQYAEQDWKGAIARFSDALKQVKEPVTVLGQDAVYFYRGSSHYYKNDYQNAIADYNQALKLKPNFDSGYNNRGIAYAKQGKYSEAIADFNQTLKLNPNDALAYNNRGNAYADQGKYSEAIADFNQALKFNPNDALAYNNRGVAHSNQGKYGEAIADYNQALKLKPNLSGAYENRGNAYANQGQYSEAIADYNQAIKLNPNLAGAYYNKACAYSLKREVKAAIENLQQAIHLDAKFREVAKTDSDFDNLRQNQQFRSIVEQ
jgi:tetratricopeptide (TPR) repeat protein